METFHQRLRRLRKNSGFTIRDLAKKISVPESTYREWEYGRGVRGQPYLKLADALEVSVYELLGGSAKNKASVMARFHDVEKAVSALGIELMSLF
jgi:transcriptional regulator with XRE-family HTH domain